MKKGLHPEYKKLDVVLTDGSTIETRSTMSVETLKTEVDAMNHPFYTGKRQFVDTAGRVEKFRRRYGDTTRKKEKEESTSE
jgi:large subunit ribosomal protein L31